MDTPKELSYPRIQGIIESIDDLRTKAMVATQYALAARAGELISYTHTDGKETPGLLKSHIVEHKGVVICEIPNFKNRYSFFKKPFISPKEAFLFEPFKAWYDVCGEQVFDLRISRYRQLVDAALPEGYSSHSLRHSRATHLSEVFDFNAYEIKAFLGHARLETSVVYVNADLSKSAGKLERGLEKW